MRRFGGESCGSKIGGLLLELSERGSRNSARPFSSQVPTPVQRDLGERGPYQEQNRDPTEQCGQS
jgi:hypothetical protein